jgi:superfamily I DNA/RNA helicase
MWFTKVKNDILLVPDCIDYYERELAEAMLDLNTEGIRLEVIHRQLPSRMAYRYNQLQELEAILEHFSMLLNHERSSAYKRILETNKRALSQKDIEKYTDCESSVQSYAEIINEIAFTRNKFLGLTKGYECLNFQIGHISRLRIAGMDDATL